MPDTRSAARRTPATVDVLDPDALRSLLSTPPPAFVAARNALVKALRAEKDREAAATVAAIRRPAWSEWALNVTSGSHPDEIAAFAEAAAAVRDAQDAAVDGRPAEIRPALQDLRQRTAAVATPANAALQAEAAKGDLPALMAQLAEIAGSAEAVERLRNGTVGTGEAAESDLFAGLAAAPAPRPARAARGKKAASADSDRAGKAADPPAPTAAERRRLMRDLADAERDLKRARARGAARRGGPRRRRRGGRGRRAPAGGGGGGSRRGERRRRAGRGRPGHSRRALDACP